MDGSGRRNSHWEALFVLGLSGLLSACAAASPTAEDVAPAKVSATPSGVAAAAPPPAPIAPRLVLATVPQWPYGYQWRGLVPSQDGKLVAFFGSTTKLVSTEDGSVRAELPLCSSSAAFSPDARSLYVATCPQHLESTDLTARHSAETTVLRWDLERDETHPFASGRFDRVAVPPGGDGVLLIGRDRVQLRGLTDGSIKRTLSVLGQEEHDLVAVAPTAERAVFSVDTSLVLVSADGAVTKLGLTTYDRSVFSTDLQLLVRSGPDKRLQLTEAVGAKVVASLAVPEGTGALRFSPTDQRLAVHTNGHIGVVDRAGKLLCEGPAGEVVDWSSDGRQLLLREDRESLAVMSSEDCQVAHRGPLTGSFSTPLATNSSLDVVARDYLSGEITFWRKGESRKPQLHQAARPGRGGAEPVDYGEVSFDLQKGLTIPQSQGEEIVVPAGVLSARTKDGAVVPVRGKLPDGLVGELFFRDAKGKDTVLPRSKAFAEGSRQVFEHCLRSRTGAFVMCNRVREDGQFLGVWDAKARWVGEVSGTYASFSTDDSRLLVLDYTIGGSRLFETSKLRQLFVDRGGRDFNHTQFGDGDALISWNGTGVVDAKSGKVVWGTEETDVVGWLRGPGTRVIERSHYIAIRRDSGGNGNAGPLRILDGRSGKLLHAFDVDVEIGDQSKDGSLLLTRDALDAYRIRDGATYAEITALGTWSHAWFDEAARFVTCSNDDALVTRRLADGVELVQVPATKPGQRGLAFTREGLFDGDPEALSLLRRREGGPLSGKLHEVGADTPGYRPGLVQDFWAGKSIAR